MRSTREIEQLLAFLLLCLALLGLSASYWATIGAEKLLERGDNPRLVVAEARIQRGQIFDRDERLLVHTVLGEGGLERRTVAASAASITGYASLRYSRSGAEAAYDDLLAGRGGHGSLVDYFERGILRRTPVGADIMLSLDLTLQDALVTALGGKAGAGVALDAASGAILALASLPSYEPNRLDEQWADLVESPGEPFFNRALQGNYQLGGNVAMLWLAEAQAHMDEVFSAAAEPVDLGEGMELSCLLAPASPALSLREAFVYGCPAAFARYARQHSGAGFDALLAGALRARLEGFPAAEPLPTASEFYSLPAELLQLRRALGQGEHTASPLQVAGLVAAITQDGLVRSPWLLQAVRAPGQLAWQRQPATGELQRILPAAGARAVQAAMRSAWVRLQAGTDGVGIQIAQSQAGDEQQLWLNGFVESASGTVAFTLVLEGTRDTQQLLALGGEWVAALSRAG